MIVAILNQTSSGKRSRNEIGHSFVNVAPVAVWRVTPPRMIRFPAVKTIGALQYGPTFAY
jgi:hypothetical protein